MYLSNTALWNFKYLKFWFFLFKFRSMKIVKDTRHLLPLDKVPPRNIWCLICGYAKSRRRAFYSAQNLHYRLHHKGVPIPPHSTTLFMKPVVVLEPLCDEVVEEVSIYYKSSSCLDMGVSLLYINWCLNWYICHGLNVCQVSRLSCISYKVTCIKCCLKMYMYK